MDNMCCHAYSDDDPCGRHPTKDMDDSEFDDDRDLRPDPAELGAGVGSLPMHYVPRHESLIERAGSSVHATLSLAEIRGCMRSREHRKAA
jgi:hypothetical protein